MSLNSARLKQIEQEISELQFEMQQYMTGGNQVRNEQNLAVNALHKARMHLSNLSRICEE